MTDNSNFVLRWEIDNPAATLATGKAESGVFKEGGFEWKLGVRPNAHRPTAVDFILNCDHPRGGEWRCETDVELVLHRLSSDYSSKKTTTFNGGEQMYSFDQYVYLSAFTQRDRGYNTNGQVIIKIRVNIISSESEPYPDLVEFSSPNEKNNVTLVIGDKKVRVSKDYLAIHSPVFAVMFFGDFVEKGKEEVEIRDVVYEEFCDLLHVLFLGTKKITDRTVLHLLKLADQFQMKRVLELLKDHLTQSNRFEIAKKLSLADQYRFVSLRDHCLHSFTRANDVLQKLMSSPEYARFSGDTKIAICDRMAELSGSVS